jgi:hypothetical protein
VRPASAGGEQLVVLAASTTHPAFGNRIRSAVRMVCSWRAMTSPVRQRLTVAAASVIAA